MKHKCSDVIVYMCHNCIPEDGRLPRQWVQGDVHVQTRMLPCTGKINAQYIFHALEGGCRGVCVVACPPGECTLSQGNYRAEMRVNTARRLLAEIELEPSRVGLIHFSKDEDPGLLKSLVEEFVNTCSTLGESPVFVHREKVLVN